MSITQITLKNMVAGFMILFVARISILTNNFFNFFHATRLKKCCQFESPCIDIGCGWNAIDI